MKSKANNALPIPVSRALRKLGQDIRYARIRRRIPLRLMAERAFTTKATLLRVEKGTETVSIGIYATVLFILGMTERLADLADYRYDSVGVMLEEKQLPKRVHLPKDDK